MEEQQGKKNTHKLGEGGGWGKKASVLGPDWPDTATTTAHYSYVFFKQLGKNQLAHMLTF